MGSPGTSKLTVVIRELLLKGCQSQVAEFGSLVVQIYLIRCVGAIKGLKGKACAGSWPQITAQLAIRVRPALGRKVSNLHEAIHVLVGDDGVVGAAPTVIVQGRNARIGHGFVFFICQCTWLPPSCTFGKVDVVKYIIIVHVEDGYLLGHISAIVFKGAWKYLRVEVPGEKLQLPGLSDFSHSRLFRRW